MTAAMISTIVTICLKIIGWFIDRQSANDKTKKSFLEFLKAMEQYLPKSAQLRDEYEKARQENLDKLKNNSL